MRKLYAAAALILNLSSCMGSIYQAPIAVRVVNPVTLKQDKCPEREKKSDKGAAVEVEERASSRFYDKKGNFRWYIMDSEFKNGAKMGDYEIERAKRDVNVSSSPGIKDRAAKTLDEIARKRGW